ncbi:MAG: LytTR family transcriptional regulator, partial [Cytophagaceae bacterium]|nr:LytTR family transcriptional regulator [Cytophagaceae bacterium]
IWLKSGTRRINVALNDILYVQGLKDYSLVFTPEGRHVVQGSLKVTENLLPAGRFVRVHKSFLVPVGSLRRFNRGQIELENVPAGQRRIPVGRSYRKDVEKWSQL